VEIITSKQATTHKLFNKYQEKYQFLGGET